MSKVTYYVSTLKFEGVGDPVALFRRYRTGLYSQVFEQWQTVSKVWVGWSPLIAVSGIGGDDTYEQINDARAAATIRALGGTVHDLLPPIPSISVPIRVARDTRRPDDATTYLVADLVDLFNGETNGPARAVVATNGRESDTLPLQNWLTHGVWWLIDWQATLDAALDKTPVS